MLFDLDSKYSIPMEIHPRMAWIHQIAEICQRWGGMDAAIEPPWMGLRRVLPVHVALPTHGMPAFAVEVAGQRPALPGVQGAAPPKNTHKKTAGRGLLFRCNGAPGEIRTPDRLVRSQVL
ncbi:hypothetical protein, partial [Stenotrophomonas pavanii]|uniref:hypothetical protein n=1 Tax=Stenotrophomonas pavanii TaxID=487698 RepID=UPI0039C69FC7